jgi:energy-coupling factor transport system ATP-binding protein
MMRFNHVCFDYDGSEAGEEPVIQDVSFHIGPGEFVALLGENGAGKSTLARLGNGLLKPSSGSVEIMGRSTARVSTSLLAADVGFLFQNPDRQLCQNTVRAELCFGLEQRFPDGQARERRVEEMLALFALDGGRAPFGLSRGERQRVALASVLARRPRLLILDEPTTGLDYRECTAIMEIIGGQNRADAAVLMVSHDMEVVLDYSRRALVLSHGRLLADAPTRDVMKNTPLLEAASLLPAQIPALALAAGGVYRDAFTVDDMMSDTVKQEAPL